MQRLTLISTHIFLLIYSFFASPAIAQEIVPCETLYETSRYEITVSNAQVFFQDALLCIPENDASQELILKHLMNLIQAVTILGSSDNRFVATRLAIVTIERNGIDPRSAPIAWRHTVAGLVGAQLPLDVRDYLFILSNIAVQNQIFEALGVGSEVDLGSKLLKEYLVPLNRELGLEVVDAENYGTQAICFVKSDIGGSVEEIFASPRYIQCIDGS